MNNERLEIIREKLDVNKSELARRIGSPQSHISKVLSGKETIGKHLSEQIIKRLHINKDWWVTGEGEIFLDSYSKEIPEPGIFTEGNIGSVRPNLKEYYTDVKLLSARAQMGMPLMTHETFNLNWLEETYPVFMPTIALNERHLVIEVIGDSMVPEIKDRALVLSEAIITNDIKYQSGAVFAVLYAGNHFVVKRIKTNDLNLNGTLTLWSDNERYGNIIIHGEDIIHVWKVIEKVKEPVR